MGGTVKGLLGTRLVLRDNGGDDLVLEADGHFAFATPVAHGATYAVTVAAPPANPAQTCTVAHGEGTVGDAAVSTVEVTCATAAFTVGGTVAGLQSGGLTLTNNGGDDLALAADGPFVFATPIASGEAFAVAVKTQPGSPAQRCVVVGGTGTLGAGPVTSVTVNCAADRFVVGGTVAGLEGVGLVLALAGGSDLPIAANGTFAFPVPVAAGQTFAVTVKTQPTSPRQTCTVTGGTGTLVNADVTSLEVVCATDAFLVGGTLAGLTGSGASVVLTNNGADARTLTANGAWSFPARVKNGERYGVAVSAQPGSPAQTCVVSRGSGSMGTTDVTTVEVACTVNAYLVQGVVTGLSGQGLVLQNNGGGDLAVSGDGVFEFGARVPSGHPFAVTVKTQPTQPSQTCVVTGGAGTVGAGPVTSVTVNCSADHFTVGGTLTGLEGAGLVLQNNGGDDLTLSTPGTSAFGFSGTLASGQAYAVTVKTQPSSPAQACVVTSGGSGTMGGGPVSSVVVACTTRAFTVSATVGGLVGQGLVLQDNGGDDLAVTADGLATFATPVKSGARYEVTVKTQPTSPLQTCTVTNGVGTVGAASALGPYVTCVTRTFPVSVTVSGLSGQGLVLRNNAGDDLALSTNGTRTFAAAVASGGVYAVTVLAQPTAPTQTCVVTGGSGPVVDRAITTVAVACTTDRYPVGGVVSGLLGSGLVLQNNGGDALAVAGNGAFTFAAPVESDQAYAVTVGTLPSLPNQACTVTHGAGLVPGHAVTDVFVDCALLPPVLTGMAPTAQAPFQNVTLTGAELAGATQVTFGGGPAATIVTNTATALTVQVPLGSSSGAVSVTTPGGTTTLPGFTYLAPPNVTALAVPLPGGRVGACVAVNYTVQQPQGLPADVLCEYGSIDAFGVFQLTGTCTQAGTADADAGEPAGVSSVATSAAGSPHVFLWNSSVDLPRKTVGGVAVRVRARRAGVFGTAVAPVNGVTVVNGVDFAAGASGDAGFFFQPNPADGGVQAAGMMNPVSTVSADFNHDGVPDLVASMGDWGGTMRFELRSFLGARDGSGTVRWALASVFSSGFSSCGYSCSTYGSSPHGLVTGDFNHDGQVDLVSLNSDSNVTNPVSLYLGNGNGTFQAPQAYGRGSGIDGANAAVAVDLNQDGYDDLVLTTVTYPANSKWLTVLMGGPGGLTYLDHVFMGTDGLALAAGDLDGDGRPDIVSVNSNNTASVFLRVTPASPSTPVAFAPATSLALGARPSTLALGDLDADGRLDLVVGFNGNISSLTDTRGWLAARRGLGNGSFAAPTSSPTPTYEAGLVLQDLDGDGRLDATSTNFGFGATGTFAVALGVGDGTLQASQAFPTGANPVKPVVVDANADGRPDLLVANTNDNSFAVYLNTTVARCDPGFSASTLNSPRTLGLFPSVAVGDLDGDGKPDLVAASSQQGQVVVQLGLGNGASRPGVAYAAGAGTNSVALRDLNHDGKLDVVATNATDGTVSVLLGRGDGTLAAATTVAAGAGAYGVAIGDVDGDSLPDLVTANSSAATVSVLRGQGDGTFAAATTFAVGTTPEAVVLVDLDGDLKADLAVANAGSNTVSFLQGDGQGGFAAAVGFAVGPSPEALATEDLDGDGRLDLVTANSGDGTLSLLRGTAAGGFVTALSFPVGGYPLGVAIGDLNGDGRPDVVATDGLGHAVSVLLGQAAGVLGAATRWGAGLGPVGVALADLNGDLKVDLAVGAAGYDGSAVLLGRGDGTFRVATQVSTGTANPGAVAVGDLNADGRSDVVTVDANAGQVSVLLAAAAGGFAAPVTIAVGSGPRAVAVGDVTGDGRPDLVVAQSTSTLLAILAGNGDGTFQAPVSVAVGTHPVAVALGDLNGDHRLDLVAANEGGDSLSVLLSAGGGSFGPPRVLAVGTRPEAVVLADLDADGRLDLVAANSGSASVSVILQALLYDPDTGEPYLDYLPAQHLSTGAGTTPYAVAVGDFNADGWLDLASANAGDVSVLLSSGRGAWSATAARYGGLEGMTSLVAVDVTGDGRRDLVAAGGLGHSVAVYEGRRDGSFRGPALWGAGEQCSSVAVADLDRDGLLDVVGTTPQLGALSILSGR